MQKSCVKSIKSLCGDDTQIIMSTHSPYILSSGTDLKGVYRLLKSGDGLLRAVRLASISTDRIDFVKLRKLVPYEMELLEALFAPLVVIWEGDCEAGLYPALMRQIDRYPSEWLAGVTGNGDFVMTAHSWFNKAEYQTIVVIDGDKPETLRSLSEKNVPFLALPSGMKIEGVVAEALAGMAEDSVSKTLLSAIGCSGFISWHEDFYSIWPSLAKLFELEKCVRTVLPTDKALAKINDNTDGTIRRPRTSHDIQRVLEKNKNRRVYETLGLLLCKEKTIPATCIKVLVALEEIWNEERLLKQYQMDTSGELKDYRA